MKKVIKDLKKRIKKLQKIAKGTNRYFAADANYKIEVYTNLINDFKKLQDEADSK